MSTPSQHHTTPPHGNTEQKSAPTRSETLQQVLTLWAVMVGLELVHQIFNVLIGLLDPSALRAAARQQSAAEGLSDAVVNATATAAVLLMGLLNLAIIGVLTWMIFAVKNRSKRAPTAYMLLMIFSFFFAFRALLVFMASPSGDVPVALYAIDGSIQILTAVVGIIAYLLARKPEVVEWIGPTKPPRPPLSPKSKR